MTDSGSAAEHSLGLRRDVLSFARRDGRASRKYAAAWSPENARFFVEPRRAEREASIAHDWTLDAPGEFGRQAPLVVEIGSGTGDALLAHAARFPQMNHLGVEVYRPGVGRTVTRARAGGATNVRVLEGDAASLVAHNLPGRSVHELHVWFPDPWPKSRHHKRRLINAAFLERIAEVLVTGGVVRLATDWADYAVAMADSAAGCTALEPAADAPEPQTVETSSPQASPEVTRVALGELYGQTRRYAYRPETRFENKGLAAGRPIADFAFRAR